MFAEPLKCNVICHVTDYKTNFYMKMKRQMSILSKRANATARHEIDSKLKTMRIRITENSARRGVGIASFYIFSKAWYLHKDYFKLSEEIFPKPSAHSWQSFSSPSVTKQTLLMMPNRCESAPRFG